MRSPPVSLGEALAISSGPTDVLYRMGADARPTKWHRVLKQDPCAYCGGRSSTIDHIIPLVAWEHRSKIHDEIISRDRPATAGVKNATPACTDCNTDKADDSLLGFLARRLQGQLRVIVSPSARRTADENLGMNPAISWWQALAQMLAGLARPIGGGVWLVPAVSAHGVDLTLTVAADLRVHRGYVYEARFTSIEVVP